ncbi:MAG TPA: cytochrome c biogenesis protein CcdA [Streptosporangiaceae bacterium]|nr:cytochrome c biogenesis protein CcdA [Streptosporangiaceae bacterium]
MSGGIGHLVLSGPLILAVPVAAAAGAVTFLSPCILPLVPGYLSYVTGMSGTDALRATAEGGPAGQGVTAEDGAAGNGGVAVKQATQTVAGAPARPARSRTLAGTLLFVLGFSAVFATGGAAFGSLGFLLREHTAGLTQLFGGLTIVLGLLFAGVFDRFPITGRIARPSVRPRAGLAGAPLLGVVFGLSWTPCVGPTLAVVMGLAAGSGTAVRGAVLMFVYGLGLGIPFLIVALAFERGMTAFAFAKRHARLVTRIGGAMLVLVGILQVTGAWSGILLWMKLHWLVSYQSPI